MLGAVWALYSRASREFRHPRSSCARGLMAFLLLPAPITGLITLALSHRQVSVQLTLEKTQCACWTVSTVWGAEWNWGSRDRQEKRGGLEWGEAQCRIRTLTHSLDPHQHGCKGGWKGQSGG